MHGFPPSTIRQPGDMGNIVAENSVAKGTLTIGQGKMSLVHEMRSIVGRVIVIHSKTAPHPNPNRPAHRNLKQDLGGTISYPYRYRYTDPSPGTRPS